ncbi:hypothetical protein [Streptomyces adustus]
MVDTYARVAHQLLGAGVPEDPGQAAAAFLAWLEPKAGQRPCR